ncbi:MAG: SMI1/KNR4 family protein [Armatimonadota bacterium]
MSVETSPLTDDDIAFIHNTLERMRHADPKLRVYLAKAHKYKVGLPIPEEDLSRFEKKTGITLPADWRSFLARVGPGAGPKSGVEYHIAEKDLEMYDLQNPFPYTEATGPFDDWEEEVSRYPHGKLPGAICIGYLGGDVFGYLVVNGPTSGTVWAYSDETYWPSGITFWQWYSRWLTFLNDVAVPQLQRDAPFDQVLVGMTLTEVIRICEQSGITLRETYRDGNEYTLSMEGYISDINMTSSSSGKQEKENKVKRIVRFGISNKAGDFGIPGI